MIKIVLDPGHGGKDPGAVHGSDFEKNLNLAIASETFKALNNAYNVDVNMTRKTDIYLGLNERAKLANDLKADYFVSLHINSGGGTGFESYIYTNASYLSKAYQELLHDQVANYYKTKGFPDRGKKRANFAVLRETNMPAILMENLFIDQSNNLAFLTNTKAHQELGLVIAQGIARALKLEPKSSGTSPGTPQPTPPDSPPPQQQPSAPEVGAVWDPGFEIGRLKKDGLLANDHNPNDQVTWGEFATVLNRIRDRLK